MNRLDPKQISFMTTVGLWKSFKSKCAKIGRSCKDVIIELICKWLKGEVKIPGEK